LADIGQEKEPVTEQEEAFEKEPAAERASEPESVIDDADLTTPVIVPEETPEAGPETDRDDAAKAGYYNSPDDSERRSGSLTKNEFIREQIRLSRVEWFNEHRTLLFAAVGIALALLIFLCIRVYNSNHNPATWLVQSCVKDFGTSFDFDITLSQGDSPAMKYVGSADFDRSAKSAKVLYDADYVSYTYQGALYAGDDKAIKGTLYKEKWTVEDCSDQVRDFFALDKSMKNGRLDAGALLRFLGMTSDFSSEEIDRFSKRFSGLLASDSALATVKAESVDGGARYSYEISVGELFRILVEDGAPLFFHSSDYNAFKERYMANKRTLDKKVCKMSYVIDKEGYLSAFDMEINADDIVYRLDCSMSDFGKAEVELPAGFLEAAGLTEKE